jgi:hypothetical protein
MAEDMTKLNTPELGELLKELAELEITCRIKRNGELAVKPKSKVSRELKKRLKRHKPGLVAMHRMMIGEMICPACLTEIPDSEPHITIEQAGEQKHFHRAWECQEHAAGILTKLSEGGEIFWLRLFHTCGDEDAGFDCVGGCFRHV